MKQSYDRVAALDADHTDTAATALTVPCDSATAISIFRRGALGTFTEEQLPNPRNAGSAMTWRITADYPIENTTTWKLIQRLP